MGKGLNRDVLAAAALDIVDAEGLGALSMRRLAARLGVDPMAAYRHVPNKAALLDAVLDAVLSRVDASRPPGADARAALRHLTRAILTAIAEHPNAAPLLAERTWTTPTGLALTDRCLALAGELSADPRRIALAVNATGLLLVSLGIAVSGASSRDDAGRLAALDAAALPHLAALAAAGHATVDYRDVLDFWLDATLAALTAPSGHTW